MAGDEPPSVAERAIFATIDRLRHAASKLKLDGLDNDWKEFHATKDAKGDAGDNSHLDLTAAAIAPTETDVWVLLVTAGSPSQDPYSYYVFLDLVGDRNSNVKIEYAGRGEPLVGYRLDGDKVGPKVVLHKSRALIGRVVEMRIALADLATLVSDEQAKLLSGKEARPWVRAQTRTWDGRARKIVDHGPAVASFRLRPTPCELDEPLPKRPEKPIVVALPTRGRWYVVQSSFGSFSHQNTWACDLTRLDLAGNFTSELPDKNGDKETVENYYAFKQAVHAPLAGTVLRARGSADDSPVHTKMDARLSTNYIDMEISPAHVLNLCHFTKDGVLVAADDEVREGQLVGRVGNSGASDTPHLHVSVRRWFPGGSVPLAFHDVRVSLNDAADDPWARDLPAWEPRKGYFVEVRGTGDRGQGTGDRD